MELLDDLETRPPLAVLVILIGAAFAFRIDRYLTLDALRDNRAALLAFVEANGLLAAGVFVCSPTRRSLRCEFRRHDHDARGRFCLYDTARSVTDSHWRDARCDASVSDRALGRR